MFCCAWLAICYGVLTLVARQMNVSSRFFIRRGRCSEPAFSLIEVMIAVVLIGVLAALAVPAFQRLLGSSRDTMFASDLRAATHAIERYALEHGSWPPDAGGSWPEGLIGFLPPPDRWNKPTPIGGSWVWSQGVGEHNAALSVDGLPGGAAHALALDRRLDDGDPAAGSLRVAGARLVYVFE